MDNTDFLEKFFKETGGQVIKIEKSTACSFNPLDPTSTYSEPEITQLKRKQAVDLGIMLAVRLKDGGFESLPEAHDLIRKFFNIDPGLASMFKSIAISHYQKPEWAEQIDSMTITREASEALSNWFANDCTKAGLIKIINDLGLDTKE